MPGMLRTKAFVMACSSPVPVDDDYGPLREMFHRWFARTVLGHDPSVQLLSPHDLDLAADRRIDRDRPCAQEGGCLAETRRAA